MTMCVAARPGHIVIIVCKEFEQQMSKGSRSASIFSRIVQPCSVLALLVIVGLLAGCAGDPEEYDAVQDIREAYETAQKAMMGQNYRKAIGIFEALQARFPFSDFAKQIQLELMYCYYKVGRQDEAISAADQFIRENPTHARVDYALYIKALAYFEKGPGFLERWFRRDVEGRPPRDGELAGLSAIQLPRGLYSGNTGVYGIVSGLAGFVRGGPGT